MPRKPPIRAYANNADNVGFSRILDELAGFGMTQRDVAAIIQVSPGQISRINKGERHAPRKHLRLLQQKLRELEFNRNESRIVNRPKRTAASIFAIDQTILRQLSSEAAVEAFRDLLWARATERAIPTTRISIPRGITVPDGGVDASILDDGGPRIDEDELLTTGTRFQIKTGNFAPWQESKINNELFGKKPPSFQNLGIAVQQTLCEGKRFVLVSYGIDPIDANLRKARQNLASAFAKCGYPNAKIDVWGQTQLIGLFQRYPSLCLRLLGLDHQGFRSLASWSSDADMSSILHYSPELHQQIEEFRRDLRTGTTCHLRLIGEPGVGKTRLALEIANTAEFGPATLYVRDGRSLLQSSLINELIQVDDRRFVILVIDECTRRDCADIWNLVRSRSDRIRIITIDHGPDDATDEKMQVFNVQPVTVDQIIAIIKDHGVAEHEARRWAEYCQGCPRVAHVIGENLQMKRPDVLQSPATVDIWDRFIVGRDDGTSDEIAARKLVLRYLSLFERFGFEKPVDREARFIAELAGLPWPRFQEIVASLKRRRILQGAKTLYITPRLLQIYLYREFWSVHGSSFDVTETMRRMPPTLRYWFVQMLRYAHQSESAEHAVRELLGPQGLFANGFHDLSENGQLVQVFAEACPGPTLRCLKRAIGSMSVDRLRSLKESRQSIVWTLERIAVWRDSFVGAAELLLALAEAENATYVNNSTGTFSGLFSLIPGMAATEADHSMRFAVLKDALNSESLERRRVALKACACALRTQGGHRIVGPEHQGLRKSVDFWYPETYGDLWNAYRDVWNLLTSKLDVWTGGEREELMGTIIDAARHLLPLEALTETVLVTVKQISRDPAVNIKDLIGLLRLQLRFHKDRLPPHVVNELIAISDYIDGHDFPSKLRRFVQHATTDDDFDENLTPTGRVQQMLAELAADAALNPDILNAELPWLVRETSAHAGWFGEELSKRDHNRSILPSILSQHAAADAERATPFLSGYLAGIFSRSVTEWETVLLPLAENSSTAESFSDLALASGVSDRVAQKVIELCRSGAQSLDRLERWWFSSRLQCLSEGIVEELLELQLRAATGPLWSNAVRMCHTRYFDHNTAKPLPEELLFRLLTHDAMASGHAAHSSSYYWSRLAAAFLQQFPSRKWLFFRAVLRVASRDWSVIPDLNMNAESVFDRLMRENPDMAFECIADTFRQGDERTRDALQTWLSGEGHRAIGDDFPGPIINIPAETLFRWVDEDPEQHGYWLAHALPKTFDKSVAGRMTRDFVAKYGSDEDIARALYANFHSRGWVGNASDLYRKLVSDAREWLVGENNQTVIGWIEDYIDGLNWDIERATLDEERRG